MSGNETIFAAVKTTTLTQKRLYFTHKYKGEGTEKEVVVFRGSQYFAVCKAR